MKLPLDSYLTITAVRLLRRGESRLLGEVLRLRAAERRAAGRRSALLAFLILLSVFFAACSGEGFTTMRPEVDGGALRAETSSDPGRDVAPGASTGGAEGHAGAPPDAAPKASGGAGGAGGEAAMGGSLATAQGGTAVGSGGVVEAGDAAAASSGGFRPDYPPYCVASKCTDSCGIGRCCTAPTATSFSRCGCIVYRGGDANGCALP